MRWLGLVALALLLSGCPPLAGAGPLPEQSAAGDEDGKGEAPVKKDGTASAGKNHLAQEKSPYLLQHADNPVDWYPWGEEAFARARNEDKPIFLSIGYAACHWCHVMEHESFEDEAVAVFLNEHFISIKVDREERPDVDTIYMTACQAMTGGGGWPLTAFLTPDLEPFFAGTYFPPQDAHGRPGFMTLLNWVTQGWISNRAELEKQAKKLAGAIVDMQRNSGGDDLPAESLLASYVSQCAQRFDGLHGGFGRAPKFPRPAVLDLLLRTWKRSEDAAQLDMVVRTLDAMAGGGMYDQVGGGFHRYSVDAQWLVPHFEKMLYDNAQLVSTYLDAWLITGDQRQARIVRECLDWTLREMTHEAGGFFSSLDADSLDAAGHKEEGAFYTWTPGELEEVLGKEQASLYSSAFGVTDAGNFEGSGRTVLFVSRSLDQVASDTGKPLEAVAQLLAEAREKLRQAREARPRPGLDDKVLTSWNGLMIGAMARAGARLPEPRYTAAATQAASFVLENLRDADGRLLRRWREGDAAFKAYVDDYAFLGNGLVDLYEATWDPRWLVEARGLARDLVKLFADEDRGGFFFTGSDHEKLLARSKDPYDGALPSGNSMAALLLARVSGYTLDAGMRDHARRTVAAFAQELEKMPFAHPMLAVVFERLLGKGREVVIAGDPEAEATVALVDALRKRFLPGVVVATVPAAGVSEDLSDLILLTGKTAVDGEPVAYVCEGGVCHQPVTSVAELEKALDGE